MEYYKVQVLTLVQTKNVFLGEEMTEIEVFMPGINSFIIASQKRSVFKIGEAWVFLLEDVNQK